MSLMVLVLPRTNSSFKKKKVLAVVLLDSDALEVIFLIPSGTTSGVSLNYGIYKLTRTSGL